jgi:hypothetical protein
VPLAGGHQHGQRPTAAITSQVELGRQPASATTQCLAGLGSGRSVGAGSPFRAPAACWWARTMVASTTTSQSTSPTASERVWAWPAGAARSHRPASGGTAQSRSAKDHSVRVGPTRAPR